MDRIAYIGLDGNLFTVKSDGADLRRLTGTPEARPSEVFLSHTVRSPNFYTWPTWSPDGTKLALSRVETQDSSVSMSVRIVDFITGQMTKIYENAAGASHLVAPGSPHYLYWSPDSKRLAILSATAEGLSLFVATLGLPGEPPMVLRGAPMYLKWSKDSNSLLLHVGADLLLAQLLSLQSPKDLGLRGESFRAPAWSPDGSKVLCAAQVSGQDILLVADIQGRAPLRPITKVIGPSVAFLWSPKGNEIAVVDNVDTSTGFYQRLRIVASDGVSERTLAQDNLIAFFWAPSGEKLAYATYTSRSMTFTWKVVLVKGGEPQAPMEFIPSPELYTLFSYFDQYTYSHSLWSPDSTKLVFTGVLRRGLGRRNGGSPDENRVYVMDVDKGTTPSEVASGRLAFWSWN